MTFHRLFSPSVSTIHRVDEEGETFAIEIISRIIISHWSRALDISQVKINGNRPQHYAREKDRLRKVIKPQLAF